MQKNIVLIGMRGSGKSTIGRLLARRLQREYIETDTRIEERAGKPIRVLVSENGWEAFRRYEKAIVSEAATQYNCVIATGGGIVLQEENIKSLKKTGYIVWLSAPVDLLLSRIGNDPDRPFLTDAETMKEDVERTLAARTLLYRNASDTIINQEGKTTDEIIEEILTRWKDI